MQLFSVHATMSLFFNSFYHEKLKKHPQKMLRNAQFFLPTPWATQTAQTEEFMFQNVTYRPTVHKTGDGVQYAEKLRRNDKKHDSK